MKIDFDKLVLGDTAEPQEMEKIVQGLRILVRLGDRARRALAAIEQGKEFNKSFPYIWVRDGWDKNTGVHDARLGSCSGVVHRQGVTRKDFPGYKHMKLVLGSTHENSYAGTKFREFTVKVRSRIIYIDDNNGKVTVKNLRSRESIIGYVRIKKNGAATFKSERRYVPVYKLYRDQILAEESIFKFAEDVAYHLILNGTSYENKPTKIIELEQKLGDWIAEDYVFKWFNEMLDHARSITTVETVMDS